MPRRLPPSPQHDPANDALRFRLRRLGVSTPQELRRETERMLRGVQDAPRVRPYLAGSWGDGSAGQNLARLLHERGMLDDKTDLFDVDPAPWGPLRLGGSTPSLAFGAGAGTGPVLTSITGNDSLMRVNCTSGTGAAAGLFATITFAVARDTANYYPAVIPLDADVPPRQFWCTSQSTTAFDIQWITPASSTGMLFAVLVPERVG